MRKVQGTRKAQGLRFKLEGVLLRAGRLWRWDYLTVIPEELR